MEILTIAQVAKRLQVNPRWVYEQTRKRANSFGNDSFPHIKMGRYLRFDWNDVLAWLERQKRGGVIAPGRAEEAKKVGIEVDRKN